MSSVIKLCGLCFCGSRYLVQKEQRLIKRRQAAEEALKQQRELLQKEKTLAQEERNVNELVNQVRETYQRRKLKRDSNVELVEKKRRG